MTTIHQPTYFILKAGSNNIVFSMLSGIFVILTIGFFIGKVTNEAYMGTVSSYISFLFGIFNWNKNDKSTTSREQISSTTTSMTSN